MIAHCNKTLEFEALGTGEWGCSTLPTVFVAMVTKSSFFARTTSSRADELVEIMLWCIRVEYMHGVFLFGSTSPSRHKSVLFLTRYY